MAVGENKSVTVEPLGVFRVRVEETAEQDMGDRGHAHGCTRMARVGLGDNVNRKGADGVDGNGIGVCGLERRHLQKDQLVLAGASELALTMTEDGGCVRDGRVGCIIKSWSWNSVVGRRFLDRRGAWERKMSWREMRQKMNPAPSKAHFELSRGQKRSLTLAAPLLLHVQ
jgi:hypothetical protein